jgi:hypothetical protein
VIAMSNGDRLFSDPQPDAGGKNFLDALNPNSLTVVTAYVVAPEESPDPA